MTTLAASAARVLARRGALMTFSLTAVTRLPSGETTTGVTATVSALAADLPMKGSLDRGVAEGERQIMVDAQPFNAASQVLSSAWTVTLPGSRGVVALSEPVVAVRANAADAPGYYVARLTTTAEAA